MRGLIDRLRGVERDIVQAPEAGSGPYYEPQGSEIAIFEAAWRRRLPVMLKGPTGCGKTRFLEYMAHRLGRPLVSVSCHEDLTSADLVGRFLLDGESTVWQDGPLTRAVKAGAICYLDEIVEARTDSTVIIHPLTDHRRRLPLEKRGLEIEAHEDFLLVISYNPGYQTVLKDLKPSTKQRFVAIDFRYPSAEIEARILQNEVEGLDAELATRLVAIAHKARALKDHGLDEASSTRSLVYAASLIAAGLPPLEAGEAALINPLTDDVELAMALREIVKAHLAAA
ncbi:CbbQ/NirQ/NorQ/GpvN family protein [Acidiferrobacter thiooxydans]|jgi:nitric oxide reductase NorQ protein|uniref:CbbQ/NirQ/NorQ/GpvN family protein n=1 Tax=Acidiferrobacter thiooxydans TaxID=163359 RepID=A0A1C2G543_9GAMM|nr:CbbQ/NirQ/NorQ/GpvN family protein [Acidiferrobacter thiooxydans]RCN56877.1 CbbQ/NirQ/NorQ/GpvN family protein [Acidiferrobacter thiooxydans]UEN99569.1 CbbQ/NirQ/NorQ/GpvN family protein [Acidiferrobacter thiooxydans]